MPLDAEAVYIVDDEPIIAETLASIIGREGFAARAFDDPFRALASAEILTPHLLITDVMMPRMTGLDLAIRSRDSYPQFKILLFSGRTVTADLLEKAHNRGYDFELLSKPVHPADLLAKLKSYF